jgi:hypothetical protein
MKNLLSALLLLALPTMAAITIDNSGQTVTAYNTSPVTLTGFTVGSAGTNRLLMVSVAYICGGGGAELVSGITYGGTSLVGLNNTYESGNNGCVSLAYLTAPTVGTANIVVTFNGAGNNYGIVVGAMSFFGVNQTTPVGTFQYANTGYNSSITLGITTGATDLAYLAGMANGGSVLTLTLSAGTPAWNTYQSTNTISVGATYAYQGATTTITWTMSGGGSGNGYWTAGGWPIHAAATAGSSFPIMMEK